MKVAIFGGGVAGLAAAALLCARVDGCRVYERRSSGSSGGLGFILSAQALADLAAVGLPPAATRAGVQLREFRRYAPDGTLRHAQPMPAGWRAVRRTDLVAALRGVLPSRTVLPGAALTGLSLDRTGTVTGAVLAGGSDPATGAGAAAGSVPGAGAPAATSAGTGDDRVTRRVHADLYVAADGSRSVARQALFPDWPQRPARVWEIVAIAHDPKVSAWAGADFHKFSRPGLAAGLVPVGDDAVVWFVQFDRDRYAGAAAGEPLGALAERLVGEWAHPLPTLLSTTDFTLAHLWRPVDADLLPRFHSGNLALVGDAAHPLLPFTSQGVAAAIAGVRDLATALERHCSLPAALETYSASCRARCAPYIGQGRELTQRFLQPDGRADDLLPVST